MNQSDRFTVATELFRIQARNLESPTEDELVDLYNRCIVASERVKFPPGKAQIKPLGL